MSRLFIELYFDEDVDVNVAKLIQGRGFSATNAHTAGMLGADDSEQLSYAIRPKKAIVTHNRDDFLALAKNTAARTRNTGGLSLLIVAPHTK